LEAAAWLLPDAFVAAQLLGSAASVRKRLNIPLPPFERADNERRHAEARSRDTGLDFDRAFALGGAMTRDDAIRSALRCLE
ncbi:MAG: hypothetical protein ABUU24_06440, partial [Variovorax sp.]